MKKLLLYIFLIFAITSCSSVRKNGQKKMKAYNMHLNDHPDRARAELKRMRKRN